jgi:3-phenylpropionate/cinnamic acid dioxygenase small subunit
MENSMKLKSAAPIAADLNTVAELRNFVEYEAELLDTFSYDAWVNLYTDDCTYWVPAKPGQEDAKSYVSLFADDKHIMRTRVERLKHPMMHCQDPPSITIRVISNFRIESMSDDKSAYDVSSKFIMIEDRPQSPRRLYGGRYLHRLVRQGDRLKILLKKVELTNCDQSFPALSHPF